MTSVESALALVDKTEANIKLIEQVSATFTSPVLNEWRYAIRHVLLACVAADPSEVEAQKAIGHLKRAYFDSCDIVIDCQLNTLCDIHRKCLGYADVVRKVVPDYLVWLERVREAQRIHREVQAKHGADRETAYDSLASTIVELDGILDRMSFHADEISAAVRREKVNVRLTGSAKIAGIAVASLTLLKAAFWAIGRIGL